MGSRRACKGRVSKVARRGGILYNKDKLAQENLHSMPDFSQLEMLPPQSTAAPEETLSEVPCPSRRSAILTGAAICGAALLWRPGAAQASLHYSDINILRFLEEIAEMQREFFYRAALSKGARDWSEREQEVFYTIARQDDEQSGWFDVARGQFGVAKYSGFYTPNASQSRPSRTFALPAYLFGDRARLLETAIEIKETAVGAYHGQILRAREPRLMQSLACLAGVQARHAATLHELNEANYQPEAMQESLSSRQVMGKLSDYGFVGAALL